jgi:hypothetical protein
MRGLAISSGLLEGAEECDDSVHNDDASYWGCSTHCLYVRCGDGIVNGPEECDLGQQNNTAVYGDRTGCTRDCTLRHYCGDGFLDTDQGEICDPGMALPTGDPPAAGCYGNCAFFGIP